MQDTLAGLQRVSGMAPLELEALPERDTLGAGQYLRKVVADGTEWKLAWPSGQLYRYVDGRFYPGQPSFGRCCRRRRCSRCYGCTTAASSSAPAKSGR